MMDLRSIQKPLKEKTEQYCVVMQTLLKPAPIRTTWGEF
jgi:hypothetical protein